MGSRSGWGCHRYLLQKRRNATAAKRLFNRLIKKHHGLARKIVVDKLGRYGITHRGLAPEVIQDKYQYSNNRTELSHQPTRVRERGMQKFKLVKQAQRLLSVHSAVPNLFNLGSHLLSAKLYLLLRQRAFASWVNAVT